MGGTLQTNNRLSFPKHPSKIQLSLANIEMIALIRIGNIGQKLLKRRKILRKKKQSDPYSCEAPNIMMIDANVSYDTLKVVF